MTATGKEQGAELARLNSQGTSYAALARRFGLTRGKVAGLIRRHKLQLGEAGEHGITIDATENEQEITSKSIRIKTLEQLIEACDINLDGWIIERHVINKWEVGAKDAGKNIVVEPLFQVKAWLVRRVPEMVMPVVQPVQIEIPPPTKRRKTSTTKTAVVLPDPHFGFSHDLMTHELTPFHDQAALDIASQIVERIQPDVVVHLGDVLDLSEWSDKFLRSPEFQHTTQAAVIAAAKWMAQLRQISPNSETVVVEGNHDYRMEKMIITHLQAAYNLKSADALDAPPALSVPGLLGLDGMNIAYEKEYWLTDNLRCSHGTIAKQAPGATARAVMDKAYETNIFGHIHRVELVGRTIYSRNSTRVINAFSPGCLCRIDETVPGHKRQQSWQQGLGVIHYTDDACEIVPVPIQGGQGIYGGEIFRRGAVCR